MFIHCNNSRLCCQFLVSIGYSIEFLYIHDCSRIQKTKLGELIAQRLERWTFYPRDAGYRDRNVSVRLSVRLSRAGIVSKRRKLAT